MTDYMTEADSFVEGFDDGDDWADWDGEGDFDDGEASAELRRRQRQARARRELSLARQRRVMRGQAGQAWAGAGRPSNRTPATSAIRQLDLERRVQGDSIGRSFAVRDRRARRAEAATVAGVVVNQVQHSFSDGRLLGPILKNPLAGALVSAAPLLLLAPAPRGSGAGSFIRDPRVIGFALVLGMVGFAEWRKTYGTADVAPEE